jgi:hypothetical protein
MDHNLHPSSVRELDEIADRIGAVKQEFTTIIETIFDSLKSRAQSWRPWHRNRTVRNPKGALLAVCSWSSF